MTSGEGKSRIANQIEEASTILAILTREIRDANDCLEKSIKVVNLLDKRSKQLSEWTSQKNHRLNDIDSADDDDNDDIDYNRKFQLLQFCLVKIKLTLNNKIYYKIIL